MLYLRQVCYFRHSDSPFALRLITLLLSRDNWYILKRSHVFLLPMGRNEPSFQL